nr:hypothetical protein [Tanacetum cinerariifolium]
MCDVVYIFYTGEVVVMVISIVVVVAIVVVVFVVAIIGLPPYRNLVLRFSWKIELYCLGIDVDTWMHGFHLIFDYRDRTSFQLFLGKVSSIPTVLSWVDSISSDGFLPSILMLVVVIVTVITVVVMVISIVVVVAIVDCDLVPDPLASGIC